MDEQIQLISMDLIDRPVKIARETIDPERVRELAESIRESGLLQPVILRPCNGRYEMVAGDRRYLAHKLLNFKEIKAIVRELDDQETVVIRGIENLQRENLTPSEEARVYLLLKEEGGLTYVQVAEKTGRSKSTVQKYIKFGRLPVDLRRAVDEKKMTIDSLLILREIEDDDMFMFYFEPAAQNGITEKVARLWVDEYEKTKRGTYYSDGGGVGVPSGDIELKPSYVTCEVCLGPVELKLMRNMMVCPECRKKIRRG